MNVIGLCVFDQSLFVKLLLNAQFFLRVKHSRFPHTLTFPLCLICDSNQEQLTFKHEERKKASRKPRRHPYTHTGEWGRERFHTVLLERGGEWGARGFEIDKTFFLTLSDNLRKTTPEKYRKTTGDHDGEDKAYTGVSRVD